MSEFEELCGIKVYGTSTPGIGGQIKRNFEDFKVQENLSRLPKGQDYGLYILHKNNVTTFNAIDRISKILNISKGRIRYAGIKDKKAITSQYITIEDFTDQDIDLDDNNLQLEKVDNVKRPIRSDDIRSNEFTITIRNVNGNIEQRLQKLRKEIKDGIPNFYGTQRFGSLRPVTHHVGRELLNRNYRGAVHKYLTWTCPNEPQKYSQVRRRLGSSKDYNEALEYFPQTLNYETDLLQKIVEIEPDRKQEWAKVFITLPRNLRRLFIHAYQSYIFNVSLSEFISGREKIENFPAKVVGYGTSLTTNHDFDQVIKNNLDQDGIVPQDFKFKNMGELTSQGTIRAALMQPLIEIEKIDENKVTVSFELKSGRYATILIREIIKN